jgi:hypothetical protein
MATKKKAAKKKKHYTSRTLVQNFPKGLRREAPLRRLLRFRGSAACTKSSCPAEANRARNASIDVWCATVSKP